MLGVRTSPTRATKATALMVLAAVIAGVALLGAAMGLYPGGNIIDPRWPGHSFWVNFLCDLTNDVAVNGQPNHASAKLARMSLVALAVALAGFWVMAPACLSGRPRFRWTASVSGLLSVVGLLLVPSASGWIHRVAVLTSSLPALLAGILVVIGFARNGQGRGLTALGCVCVGVTLLDAILYARTFMTQPRIVPVAVPLLQRVALLSMMLWMGAVAVSVLRQPPAPAAPPGR